MGRSNIVTQDDTQDDAQDDTQDDIPNEKQRLLDLKDQLQQQLTANKDAVTMNIISLGVASENDEFYKKFLVPNLSISSQVAIEQVKAIHEREREEIEDENKTIDRNDPSSYLAGIENDRKMLDTLVNLSQVTTKLITSELGTLDDEAKKACEDIDKLADKTKNSLNEYQQCVEEMNRTEDALEEILEDSYYDSTSYFETGSEDADDSNDVNDSDNDNDSDVANDSDNDSDVANNLDNNNDSDVANDLDDANNSNNANDSDKAPSPSYTGSLVEDFADPNTEQPSYMDPED